MPNSKSTRRSGERRGGRDGDWSKGGCEVKGVRGEAKSLRSKPKALAARTLTSVAAESSCSHWFGWSSWVR